MRGVLLSLLFYLSFLALTFAHGLDTATIAMRFETFLDIQAVQPRESATKYISTVADWKMFFPPRQCHFTIDDGASKPGESGFIVTCPRFAYAKSAVTFRFETRSNTPQTLYLTSVLSDTVDVSAYEYELFLEDHFTYYGSFQSAMSRRVSLFFLNKQLYERETLLALLGLLRDDGGYKCVVLRYVDAQMNIYCEVKQNSDRTFVMDFTDKARKSF